MNPKALLLFIGMGKSFPIIVTGKSKTALVLENGTGHAQAVAVKRVMVEWKLQGKVKAKCTDSTGSKTGHTNGSASVLDRMLEEELLYVACRHHILELPLGAVFEQCLGPFTGPDIQFFKDFKGYWENINTLRYSARTALKDVRVC